jgi:spoIIIJ-associated protein
MRRLEFEAKTIEEGRRIAVEEFQVNAEYISINILEQREESVRIEALMEDNLEKIIRDYLDKVLEAMELKHSIEVRNNDRGITFRVETADNPMLIGRDGKTLAAIQSMCKQISYVFSDQPQNITIDVGGYKEKRILQLEILATKTAKEVAKSKVEARLKPMNSYERRIVHAKLSEWRDVETESVGEEPNRYLVIKPATQKS